MTRRKLAYPSVSHPQTPN